MSTWSGRVLAAPKEVMDHPPVEGDGEEGLGMKHVDTTSAAHVKT